MTHGPATDWSKDKSTAYKTRIGIRMFLPYALLYAGFIILNTLSPALMESPMMGLTLSVIYGFGLIVLAIVLALIYNWMCSSAEARLNATTEEDLK